MEEQSGASDLTPGDHEMWGGTERSGRVLHDDDLAQAIIDRVLERGRLLRLDGPS